MRPTVALLGVLLLASGARAETPGEIFEKMKSLDGRWSGRVDDRDAGEPLVLEYRLLARGKTLVEIQAPGTPSEMMTVYFLSGDELRATHYCSAGNQPEMVGFPLPEGTGVRFSFRGGSGFAPSRDGHVHDGEIRFVSANEIEHYWTWYEGGSEKSHTRWFLSRAESP
jgi:hypothetical protein